MTLRLQLRDLAAQPFDLKLFRLHRKRDFPRTLTRATPTGRCYRFGFMAWSRGVFLAKLNGNRSSIPASGARCGNSVSACWRRKTPSQAAPACQDRSAGQAAAHGAGRAAQCFAACLGLAVQPPLRSACHARNCSRLRSDPTNGGRRISSHAFRRRPGQGAAVCLLAPYLKITQIGDERRSLLRSYRRNRKS